MILKHWKTVLIQEIHFIVLFWNKIAHCCHKFTHVEVISVQVNKVGTKIYITLHTFCCIAAFSYDKKCGWKRTHIKKMHWKGLQWNYSGTTVIWLWSSFDHSGPLYALFGYTELKVNDCSYYSHLNAFTFTVK